MVTQYDHNSHRYQWITRKLVIFVGCTSVASSLAENEEFQPLIQILDPRCKAPRRAAVSKEIDKVMFDMKACVQSFLGDARKVSLCADIWTKKGLKSSYLGITACFLTLWPSTSSSNSCCQTDCATSTQCRDYPWGCINGMGNPTQQSLGYLNR